MMKLLPGVVCGVAIALTSLASGAVAAPVGEKDFDCVIEPQQTVKLATQALGVLARLDVDRGDLVHKGQIVGKLDDAVDAANLALAAARASNDNEVAAGQARQAFLRRKYSRASQLVTDNIVSRATTDEAESDMKVAESQLKLAELNLRIAQLEVKQTSEVLQQRTLVSPIDGVVVERLLVPGEYRNDQSPILTLAQIDPLRVEVFVPTAYYGQIQAGSKAEVHPEPPINGSFAATVTVVDRVMDAASGTFGVRLRLPNPDLALPAGIRCTVRFASGTP